MADLGVKRPQNDNQMLIEVTDIEIKDPKTGIYHAQMRKGDSKTSMNLKFPPNVLDMFSNKRGVAPSHIVESAKNDLNSIQ